VPSIAQGCRSSSRWPSCCGHPGQTALFTHVARTSLLVDQVLIVGTGPGTAKVARELQMRKTRLRRRLSTTCEPRATLGSLPVLGGTRDPAR
jgi:hypothetical protein